MTFLSTCNTVRNEFNARTSILTQYPNAPLITKVPGAIYAVFSMVEGDSSTHELGNPASTKDLGIMAIQLFAPGQTGDGAIMAEADTIAALFKNVTYSGVRFKVPRIQRVGYTGNPDSKNEYQVTVVCPYFVIN